MLQEVNEIIAYRGSWW